MWIETLSDPSMTGHVEASGGTLIFREIIQSDSGISFADPVRIDPWSISSGVESGIIA